MNGAWLRQFWADLLSRFWLRPAVMTVAAILLAQALVMAEGVQLPRWLESWVYAGGISGARGVLGAIAGASIGVAGTMFSITVAALTLATQQMGPRLLGNFTRDAGNQYALGTFVATFAFSLVALRSVHDAENGAFVPQLAVSTALLLAGACVAMLVWFIHHVASSINLDRVVALVQGDLVAALRALPEREDDAPAPPRSVRNPPGPFAPLRTRGGGYLRVLDDTALADWATGADAVLRFAVRPGGFVFPGSIIGEVTPAALRDEAGVALESAMSLGHTRNVEQDLEFAVRQMVEVGMRALSSGINDPFTAVNVLDQLGASLCEAARRELPDGVTWRDGVARLSRPTTDYAGLVDAMFHMLRQSATDQPAVMIRMIEVLGAVGGVESDPSRCAELRRHLELAHDAALAGCDDPSVRTALAERRAAALRALGGGADTAP
ncbi:MAG TPA: DUF2254 domain-containing protein [Falsiroseomonas sp.]|jgi:uncharacterized membrane protein|nr:DUF2254 domain-containing protein [Falsiroseomonas sp.]